MASGERHDVSHASASSRVAAALKYDACGWWMMLAAVSSTLRPRVLRRVRGRVRLRDGTRRDQPVYDLRGARNPPLRARALGSVFVHPAIDFVYPLAYRSMDGRILQFAAIAGAVVLAIAVFVGAPRIRGRDFASVAMAGTVELIYVFLANVPEVVAAYAVVAALASDYATPYHRRATARHDRDLRGRCRSEFQTLPPRPCANRAVRSPRRDFTQNVVERIDPRTDPGRRSVAADAKGSPR